jgi:Transposase DDE domain
MENYSILDEDWKTLVNFFPAGWEKQAVHSRAVARLRGFSSQESLLRTMLLHIARGYSLRETVARARMANLAEISDVALLKRLRSSEDWLRSLCQQLLREIGINLPQPHPALRIRLVDGTLVKEPGPTGSQWRIHYSLQLPHLACDFFRITATEGEGTGESLTQFPVAAEDFLIGDRGYCTASGIEYVTQGQAYVSVRVNTQALPLFSKSDRPFPLRKRLQSVSRAGQIAEWEALVKGATDSILGRLCVIRKSELAIQQALRKLKRRASRNGSQLKPETLEYAKYVLVFTTWPASQFPVRQVLDWYRLRWQIELVFKRLKSLARLGHLPKYDDQSSRAWLYGKLFVALLTHKLICQARDFSPWGYQLP